MSKTEHLRLVLAGTEDVPPAVGCWYHFPPELQEPAAAAEAHLRHLDTYDLDFLKVMNEFGYPRHTLGSAGVIQSLDDLRKLEDLPGDAEPFDRQLELIRRLAEQLDGEVPMTTTIFSAWITLRNLTAPHKKKHGPPTVGVRDDPRDALLTRMLHEDWAAMAAAVDTIGRSLANFARACIEAGADGIYLATRDDWVDTPANREAFAAHRARSAEEDAKEAADGPTAGAEAGGPADAERPAAAESPDPYDELVALTDNTIFWAAEDGWFNVVHLCGTPRRFGRHLSDPIVHVVHWADRISGPTIGEALPLLESTRDLGRSRPPAIAAGVNNLETLPNGTPQAVAGEVRDALAAMGERPLIVAPGCTYDPERVPEENIRAMVAAVRA